MSILPPLSRRLVALAIPALIASIVHAQSTTTVPSIGPWLSPASPLTLVSARKADRIAWMVYDQGLRNVYTAAAPDFKPVRATNFLTDDGTDLTDVRISDDGSMIVFVRGSAPNRYGWVANPSHDPRGAERAIWAVRANGGTPWRVAEGAAPELSPDGRWVLFTRDGQIYRARVARTPGVPLTPMDTGATPLIRAWGRNGTPRWSPDGSKIAFVSDRENHALVAVYDVAKRSVTYVSPSVDCDGGPAWSPDGKSLAFSRRPGVPFGNQTQRGLGGIGNPAGAAANALAPMPAGNPSGGCGGGGFGGQAAQAQRPDSARQNMRRSPGFYSSAFEGGHTLKLMIADPTAGKAREVWHNAPGDSVFTSLNNMVWADDRIAFPVNVPKDEWERWYAIPAQGGQPVRLTTTDGLIEDATSVAFTRDGGKSLIYTTNAEDIERRHIWSVPVAGGTPRRLSVGDGVETYPQPLASGKQIAVLYFGAKIPASVALVPAGGGEPRIIFPTLAKSFPTAAHVIPEVVKTKAADGLEISNTLFLPRDLKAGEKRPAIVFVHGGPRRQMLPAYHYMQFYHWSYAVNQWLADQGYVVLSINYRSGVGYGKSFRDAPNTQGRGNSEYQDVVAGAKYLQARADVDPSRIGIWGLSYGGLLTSQALARNSDIFVAGVDLAGVHLYGNVIDSTNLAFRSSAVGAIDGWKSPVFLVHGDDDRNVDFAQTVGLVQLLRARNIYHELIVVPDDLHESMIHANWIDTFDRMGVFLKRFVWDKQR
ncbi:prolyl oligopeptidase family serine peptidase [Gemmatimonas aurantiaca]|uniref:S9 family peptidase n=1 Tax=Gemmatimonas aurantiaca TaxID=173480 RepID=UPI00301D69C0